MRTFIVITIFTAIHMKSALTFALALLLTPTFSQVTEGCNRYIVDGTGTLRCVECFYTMGLTSQYTCEYCTPPQVVADGICKLPAVFVNEPQNPLPSTLPSVNSLDSSNSINTEQ